MGILDASELFGIASSVTSYDYRNQEEMVEAIKADPEFELPVAMTDVEMWTNYTDDVLYELDKRVREFVIAVVNPVTDHTTELQAESLRQENGTLVFTYRKIVGGQQTWSMQPVLLIKVDKEYETQTVKVVQRK